MVLTRPMQGPHKTDGKVHTTRFLDTLSFKQNSTALAGVDCCTVPFTFLRYAVAPVQTATERDPRTQRCVWRVNTCAARGSHHFLQGGAAAEGAGEHGQAVDEGGEELAGQGGQDAPGEVGDQVADDVGDSHGLRVLHLDPGGKDKPHIQ